MAEHANKPQTSQRSPDKGSKVPKKVYPKRKSELKRLGYYSVDGDRTFLPDSSQLMYFNPPNEENIHFDLDEGIQSAVRRNESYETEGIGLLLEWLKLNYKKIRANPTSGRCLQAKFICTRGTLTRIMTSRYNPQEGWIIYAAKWKGSIYLCYDKTKKGVFEKSSNNDRFSSWGYKFEQYVLSDSPDKVPDTSKPVIEPAEFRCVYQRRIGDHPVLFTAVMKGVLSETAFKDPLPLNELKFIETKTNKIIENAGQERSLRKHKFLRWWSQCYLTNTQEILCGFRDQSGIVQKLTRYDIKLITKLSQLFKVVEQRRREGRTDKMAHGGTTFYERERQNRKILLLLIVSYKSLKKFYMLFVGVSSFNRYTSMGLSMWISCNRPLVAVWCRFLL